MKKFIKVYALIGLLNVYSTLTAADGVTEQQEERAYDVATRCAQTFFARLSEDELRDIQLEHLERQLKRSGHSLLSYSLAFAYPKEDIKALAIGDDVLFSKGPRPFDGEDQYWRPDSYLLDMLLEDGLAYLEGHTSFKQIENPDYTFDYDTYVCDVLEILIQSGSPIDQKTLQDPKNRTTLTRLGCTTAIFMFDRILTNLKELLATIKNAIPKDPAVIQQRIDTHTPLCSAETFDRIGLLVESLHNINILLTAEAQDLFSFAIEQSKEPLAGVYSYSGETLLNLEQRQAFFEAHNALIGFFLAKNVRPHIPKSDNQGNSALSYAVTSGNPLIVTTLLEKTEAARNLNYQSGMYCDTVYRLAQRYGTPEIQQIIKAAKEQQDRERTATPANS